MDKESVIKPTKEQVEEYIAMAANQLKVEPEQIQVEFWEEIFSSSAGPLRKKGVIAAHALWYYGVLGFKSSVTDKKLKYCYEMNTW